MFTGIHTIIFYVSDINKSKVFYNKLGFKLFDDQGEYVSFKASNNDSVLLALNSMKRHRGRIGLQTIILRSDNINNTYKVIKDSVNITTKLIEKPWGKTFTFEDLDGNKIEVLEQ